MYSIHWMQEGGGGGLLHWSLLTEKILHNVVK